MAHSPKPTTHSLRTLIRPWISSLPSSWTIPLLPLIRAREDCLNAYLERLKQAD